MFDGEDDLQPTAPAHINTGPLQHRASENWDMLHPASAKL